MLGYPISPPHSGIGSPQPYPSTSSDIMGAVGGACPDPLTGEDSQGFNFSGEVGDSSEFTFRKELLRGFKHLAPPSDDEVDEPGQVIKKPREEPIPESPEVTRKQPPQKGPADLSHSQSPSSPSSKIVSSSASSSSSKKVSSSSSTSPNIVSSTSGAKPKILKTSSATDAATTATLGHSVGSYIDDLVGKSSDANRKKQNEKSLPGTSLPSSESGSLDFTFKKELIRGFKHLAPPSETLMDSQPPSRSTSEMSLTEAVETEGQTTGSTDNHGDQRPVRRSNKRQLSISEN